MHFLGLQAYNSSHCMSGTGHVGRKNITSGTRRAVMNIKRWETAFFVSFFSVDKRSSPFFYTPQKPSFKPINDQFIVAGIC